MDPKALSLAILFCVVVSFCCYRNARPEQSERKSKSNATDFGVKYSPKDLFDLLNLVKSNHSVIESKHVKQRLYELEYSIEFDGVFKVYQTYSDRDQLLLSGGPVVDQQQCGQQLDRIASLLESKYANNGSFGYELTMFLDSFGRLGSGAYSGIFNWLGSYDQCTGTSLDGGNIRTRYCIARMQPDWWNNNRIKIRSAYRLGICLPETCDTSSFDQHKNSIERLIKPLVADFHAQTFELESMFCLPDERSSIRQIPSSGWTFLALVFVWSMITLVSTILYERMRSRYKRREATEQSYPIQIEQSGIECATTDKTLFDKLVRALSLRVSLEKFASSLFKVDYNQAERPKVDLGFLSMFKSMMILIIVFGHTAWWLLNYTRSLAGKVDLAISQTGTLATSIGVRCVDMFLFIFGLLRAYNYVKKLNQQQIGNPLVWSRFVLLVLIKMIPTFLLVHWYIKLISPYTGSGPWWDYGVDYYSSKGMCLQSTWWESIPLLVNYINFTPCVPQAWFLVVYLKITLILPALFYVLHSLSSNRLRTMFVSFLVACSIAFASYRLLHITSIGADGLTSYDALIIGLLTKFIETGYMSVWSRSGNVVIGSLIGLWLHEYEIGKIRQWPRFFRSATLMNLAVLMNLAALLFPLISNRFEQVTGGEASLTHFVIANAVLMVLWPILNSIMVIYFATVINHKAVARFCSHPFWQVFNKLGLVIFLVHWEIIVLGFTSYEQGAPYGYIFEAYIMYGFVIMWSILSAIAIHVLFETPMSTLLMMLINTRKSTKTWQCTFPVHDCSKFESPLQS